MRIGVCQASLGLFVSMAGCHAGHTGDDMVGPAEDLAATPPDLAAADGAVAPPSVTAMSAVVVSSGTPMDYDGAFYVDPTDGAWVVVFERFVTSNTVAAELRIARSVDHASFEPSSLLNLVPGDPYGMTPSVAVVGEETYLFFSHGDYTNHLTLARARVGGGDADGGISAPEDLVLSDTASGHDVWPFVSARGGQYLLSYDHYFANAGAVALGDGHTFGKPADLGFAVQGRAVAMASGTIVYTVQDGASPDTCYYQTSADGKSWSEQTRISSKDNTHDATPFLRKDGGVDVYYIAAELEGFLTYRRQVHADGTLGVEQQLSDGTIIGTTQPRPHRLADGTIGMVFAKQVTSNLDTDTYFVHLDGDDAP